MKRTILACVAVLFIVFVLLIADALFWVHFPVVKGRVVRLSEESWGLVNQPIDLWTTVTVEGLPRELRQQGITVRCSIVTIDATGNDSRGVDGFAVVRECARIE